MLAEVPSPQPRPGHYLIATRRSLVSIGTERMLIDFGKAGWIEKARKQPDKVRQVLGKIRTDGLRPTLEAVRAKLDQPVALGYANVGVVLETTPSHKGAGNAIKPGERVVSNGPHAEVVCVPANLCTKVPDAVSDEEAAFTVVAAIGLQGIRLVEPTLGEAVVVTGLGLIGLLCVQLLRAHGCRVLGIDLDSSKCELARSFGAETVDLSQGEDAVSASLLFSRGRGMDAVVITASTTSNEPVHQAATICRKRGRIVLIGVVGLELSRADFYEKELSFQVSCSYGPGRYDDEYEQKGRDYPFGYVRWTENRNFEAVLDMMATKRIDVVPLISHRFQIDDALDAYSNVGAKDALGILLEYPLRPQDAEAGTRASVPLAKAPPKKGAGDVVVGVIGAGGFTGQVLLPAIVKTNLRLKIIASAGGVTAAHLGKKFGFKECSTDADALLIDRDVNLVVITTRHNSHGRFVVAALAEGKSVYVEKPLCLNADELDQILDAYENADAPFLMVGFNRRFAPHVQKIQELLRGVKGPRAMVMTVNAGAIPRSHWTQDPEVGGGRIIGEACHFIDLLRFLAGGPIDDVSVAVLDEKNGFPPDKISFTLRFRDGSIGTVHYLANGHRSVPKERLEVFAAGRILQLDNYRTLTGAGWPGFKKMKLWAQDKGHRQMMAEVAAALRSGNPSPIPFAEIVEATRISFEVAAKAAR